MLDDMNLKCNIKVDDDSLNYSHIEGYLKNFNAHVVWMLVKLLRTQW
jgi:uncharacterized membrane protein